MAKPPSIQAGSYTVVLDAALRIRAVSANVSELLGADAGAMLDAPGSALLPPAVMDRLRLTDPRNTPLPIPLHGTEPVDWGERQCIPHFQAGGIVLEIEDRSPRDQKLLTEIGLRDVNDAIHSSNGIRELLQTVCERLAHLLNFDRVIVYELQAEGSGSVSTEYNNGAFPLMRGIHYRMEDFLGAKRAYRREPVLVTGRAEEPPVPLIGNTEGFEDTFATRLGGRRPPAMLRQFMIESGIGTMASVALYNQESLWGVIYAHARQPVHLDYQLRTFLHLVGNQASQALTYRVFNQAHRKLVAADYIRARLRENIATASSLVEGLHHSDPSLLDVIADTAGAAVLLEGQLVTIGITPPRDVVNHFLHWASDAVDGQQVYTSSCLEMVYPPAREHRQTMSGVLLVPLNVQHSEWIVWFRAEDVQEVTYGSLRKEDMADQDLHFTPVVEIRYGCSRTWSQAEIDAARDLQIYIRDVVMEKYSQLSRVNQQLQMAYDEMQSFSYTVSHDLRAPLRGIDGFAEIFIEDYGTQIDTQGRALIQTIQQNAARMNQYIADILELSRVGRTILTITDCDVRRLARSAYQQVTYQLGVTAELQFDDDLPPLRGDAKQLETVFIHLISNAIKYRKPSEPAVIRFGYRPGDTAEQEGEFYVTDNGIGIPPLHQERVFGMFNRLVTQDEYEGNGVGLAIVRRILARHGGRVRIEGTVGDGTTVLFFTKPDLYTKGQTNLK